MTLNPRSPFTPYPRGWYMACLASELPVGAVLPLHYFGREIVAFRTEDGAPHVVDAHCPHLGSHLGHGGTVEGNCIRCPFHGWQFEGETGRCVRIPYAEKVPPNARARVWPVREIDGNVLVYFHEKGALPDWEVTPIPVEEGDWSPWQETRWKIKACIQDVSENDVDNAHLPNLHQFTAHAPEGTLEAKGPVLELRLQLETNLESLGMSGVAKGPLNTTKWGLSIGYIAHFLDLGGIQISTRTLGHTIPIDEHYVDVRLFHSIRRTPFEHVNEQLEAQYFKIFKATVEQDIVIWENKLHLARPLLCEGDGPIAAFRKWARQFYSEDEVARAMAQ
ncbi:MAG: Rieske (2Fe-2S) protein [Myxococcales bacterium]|nr:Rieske (2Fe-2S) protein [Myxococcales bacterium]